MKIRYASMPDTLKDSTSLCQPGVVPEHLGTIAKYNVIYKKDPGKFLQINWGKYYDKKLDKTVDAPICQVPDCYNVAQNCGRDTNGEAKFRYTQQIISGVSISLCSPCQRKFYQLDRKALDTRYMKLYNKSYTEVWESRLYRDYKVISKDWWDEHKFEDEYKDADTQLGYARLAYRELESLDRYGVSTVKLDSDMLLPKYSGMSLIKYRDVRHIEKWGFKLSKRNRYENIMDLRLIFMGNRDIPITSCWNGQELENLTITNYLTGEFVPVRDCIQLHHFAVQNAQSIYKWTEIVNGELKTIQPSCLLDRAWDYDDPQTKEYIKEMLKCGAVDRTGHNDGIHRISTRLGIEHFDTDRWPWALRSEENFSVINAEFGLDMTYEDAMSKVRCPKENN